MDHFYLKRKKGNKCSSIWEFFSLTYIVCYLLEIVLSIFTQLVNIKQQQSYIHFKDEVKYPVGGHRDTKWPSKGLSPNDNFKK